MDIINIPTTVPVFKTVIENWEEMNLKEYVLNYEKKYPKRLDTNVKAWRSDWQIHKSDQIFKDVADLISTVCGNISEVHYKLRVAFNTTHLWAMHYREGEEAVWHDHWPSDFSGTYYVDVDEDSSPIVFEGGIEVKPQNGMMLIFPSTLKHKVPSTEKERIAIGFNLDKEARPPDLPDEIAAIISSIPQMLAST
tara:strand:- start:7607 stop:8188 length:582 start_codon:yes stop_codon:yes gene_type:complete